MIQPDAKQRVAIRYRAVSTIRVGEVRLGSKLLRQRSLGARGAAQGGN